MVVLISPLLRLQVTVTLLAAMRAGRRSMRASHLVRRTSSFVLEKSSVLYVRSPVHAHMRGRRWTLRAQDVHAVARMGRAPCFRCTRVCICTIYGTALRVLDGPRCWCAGDMNLLKVPQNLTDDQVVLLSDVLPTSWWVASSIGT